MLSFEIRDPDAGEARTVSFDADIVRLGRSKKSDIVVEDSQCSLKHAVVRREGKDLCLVDLESRNGTFLNGEAVDSAPLTEGDTIRIGQTEIELVPDPAPVPVAPPPAASKGIPTAPVEGRNSGGSPSPLPGLIAGIVAGLLSGFLAGLLFRPGAPEPPKGAMASLSERERDVVKALAAACADGSGVKATFRTVGRVEDDLEKGLKELKAKLKALRERDGEAAKRLASVEASLLALEKESAKRCKASLALAADIREYLRGREGAGAGKENPADALFRKVLRILEEGS